MSYLNSLRLHFAGRFQAAISTVNNDPLHFDNATFEPEYQQLQTRGNPPNNGWFNPRGNGDWRLIGCKVTAAWMSDGGAAPQSDPIRQCLVADSDRQVPAKIVDLDPEQQMVSQIWGLEVRICDASGATLLRGQYEPASFMDIWYRAPASAGDMGFSAMYQSVLRHLEWGDIGSSPFLTGLRQAAAGGLLSIKFNVDGINMNFNSPEFLRGRIVGTIGPAAANEPRHFTAGRQFMTSDPQGKLNYCVAALDEARGKILLDLGNALPTNEPGGTTVGLGDLLLAIQTGSWWVQPVDDIPQAIYTDPAWYPSTAGVIELPGDRTLTSDEVKQIKDSPLVIQRLGQDGKPFADISESPYGLYCRADQFVFRLDPGEQANVEVYATRFGRPYPGARIISILDPLQFQLYSPLATPQDPLPQVAEPDVAIDLPARVVANGDGVALLPIQAKDPGCPRGFIDGQIYGVRPMLEETLAVGMNYPFNPGNFISLLVWDEYQAEEPPTWYGSIQPIMQQYANLYPVMKDFLDMGDYDSVCDNRRLLELAIGLDIRDPNSMPVTRDLSGGKRRAILRWLRNPGPGGEPLKGTPPPAAAAAEAAPGPIAGAVMPPGLAAPETGTVDVSPGGKTIAASRRLVTRLQRARWAQGRRQP